MKFVIAIKVILGVLLLPIYTSASDYPKSKIETEMDETGSLLGGEGVVFRPNKERSGATKITLGNVNKYLFQASIAILKFAPLASVDSKSGTIVTEWYTPKGQEVTQFKVMVYIKDGTISPESLEVIAFERQKTRYGYSDSHESSSISSVLEDKIIRKARDLYLQSER